MLVLFETASGFALFKVLDEGKIRNVDSSQLFSDPEKAKKAIQLLNFSKFENTTDALEATTELLEGKANKQLKEFLKQNIVQKKLNDKLVVQDDKLGRSLTEGLKIKCDHGSGYNELFRGIREQLNELLVDQNVTQTMALGLAHSMSRFKLKFSADKVDTMIVQAVAVLDALDKELNTYEMRVREWYGWHFPEFTKLVNDNSVYCKIVKRIGLRSNAQDAVLDDIIPSELADEIKEAALFSMGTDIREEDMLCISELCDQVLDLRDYKTQLSDYLKNRMEAIAPNLTALVGESIGARLISHAGSLMSLAKHPASTVQILGAEKALFRALKTHSDTPKYGLLYHASLVSQTSQKNRGKISRILAAKAALSCRVDALGEKNESITIGNELREKVMKRIQAVDSGNSRTSSTSRSSFSKMKQYSAPVAQRGGYDAYDAELETTDLRNFPPVKKEENNEGPIPAEDQPEKKKGVEGAEKKKKKKVVKDAEGAEGAEGAEAQPEKKKKKKAAKDAEGAEGAEGADKKKKKKKAVKGAEGAEGADKKKKKKKAAEGAEGADKKKKKKKKVEGAEEKTADVEPKKKKKKVKAEQ